MSRILTTYQSLIILVPEALQTKFRLEVENNNNDEMQQIETEGADNT